MSRAFSKAAMRDDIARAIAMDPNEIGGGDDLLDLGLDSMRALSLVMQWGEAGVVLEFAELAERPTLDGWWSLAEARMPQAVAS